LAAGCRESRLCAPKKVSEDGHKVTAPWNLQHIEQLIEKLKYCTNDEHQLQKLA
jgi:hypothetical protein